MMDFFRGFKAGMKSFGMLISLIINTLLLLIVYLIGVGITSIIAKIFRKRFLVLTLDRKAKSYWNTLNIRKRSEESYYRQF